MAYVAAGQVVACYLLGLPLLHLMLKKGRDRKCMPLFIGLQGRNKRFKDVQVYRKAHIF